MADNTMMGGMTDLFGNPNWGAILGNALTGGYSLYQGLSGNQMDVARQAAAMADPFASQRGTYQPMLQQKMTSMTGAGQPENWYDTQLRSLLTDPTSFKTDPGYQFAVDQGTQAAMRAGNALYGTQRSGAIAPEIANLVTGYANQAYGNRVGQYTQAMGLENQAIANQNQLDLGTLDALLMASGAKTGNPAAAGELLGWGNLMQNNAIGTGASNLGGALGAALPSILNGLGSLLGGGGMSLPNINWGGYAGSPGAPQTEGPGGNPYGSGNYPGGAYNFGNIDWGNYAGGPGMPQIGGPGGDLGDLTGGWGGGDWGGVDWGDLSGWNWGGGY